MSKDPAFLFYSSDFLTGTMFMSDEQAGKYIRLLCSQHQHGHVLEKDMMKICKTYDEDIFEKFVKDDTGKYYNERLEREVNRRTAYSDSRRKNRSIKQTDMSNICESHDEHMETETINDTVITTGIKKGGAGGKIGRKTKTAATDAPIKSMYGSQNNVSLTREELERLRVKYPDDADDAIEYLSKYIVEKKYHSESHNLAIQRWVIDAVKEKKNRSGGFGQGVQRVVSSPADRIMEIVKNHKEVQG